MQIELKMVKISKILLGACFATVIHSAKPAAFKPRNNFARVLKEPSSIDEVYDYVIVGGGTAGLTVGDRLSEDAKGIFICCNSTFSSC